jgi:hypothetical protein
MPRAPRIDFPDGLYHVISRGNGRQQTFFNDEDMALPTGFGQQRFEAGG